MQKAIASAPDNEHLQLTLTEALLYGGRKEEGLAAAQKLATKSSEADILNDVAWSLAETGTDLPLAKQYSEKSVSTLESGSKEVALSRLSDEDLRRVTSLAAAWDTLGWIYFHLGDTAQAEKYLDASWRLTQSATVADHLGQIYAKEGKQQAAIHLWQLALAANNGLDEIRQRLQKMGAYPDRDNPTLRRKRVTTVQVSNSSVAPGEELGKLRTTNIPDLPKQEASAEFFLLFSAAKVEDAQFISGSDALKQAAGALLKAHYNVPFPDDGPEKIARRGILSCSIYTSPSCQFVLLLPSTTTR